MAGEVDKKRLGSLLAQARRRARPADYAGLAELRLAAGLPSVPEGRGRHVEGLTQQDIDLLLGRQPGAIYARLERGMIAHPKAELLRDVGHVLALEESEWVAVWLAIFGHQPPATLNSQSGFSVPEIWATVIHRNPMPAFISTVAWDVIDYNAAAEDLFGEMPPNIMRWILLTPPARGRSMRDWEQCWVPSALSQLRDACTEYSENPTLRQLHTEVIDDDLLRSVYHKAECWSRPEGEQRPMVHAGLRQEGVLSSASAEPFSSRGARVVFLEWTPGTVGAPE